MTVYFLKMRLKLERLLKPQRYAISPMECVESINILEALPKRISLSVSINVFPVLALKKRLKPTVVIDVNRAISFSVISFPKLLFKYDITRSMRRLLYEIRL